MDAAGRNPAYSTSLGELMKEWNFTEINQLHRRSQAGLWDGSFAAWGYVTRPHPTTDADANNNNKNNNNSNSNSSSSNNNNSSSSSNNNNNNKTTIVVINSAMENDNRSIAPINFGQLNYVGHSGRWYARYPLGVCEGDCDSDGKILGCDYK